MSQAAPQHPVRILLAVDPGSRVTGYAVFRGDNLADAGTIRAPTRDSAIDRVRQISADLRMLIGQWDIDTAIVEVPTARVSASRRGIGGHGLPVLGFAAGALWQVLVFKVPKVETVDPHIWPRGRKKAARGRLLRASEPGYAADRDAGMDAADAIEMGRWWLAQTRTAGRIGR